MFVSSALKRTPSFTQLGHSRVHHRQRYRHKASCTWAQIRRGLPRLAPGRLYSCGHGYQLELITGYFFIKDMCITFRDNIRIIVGYYTMKWPWLLVGTGCKWDYTFHQRAYKHLKLVKDHNCSLISQGIEGNCSISQHERELVLISSVPVVT